MATTRHTDDDPGITWHTDDDHDGSSKSKHHSRKESGKHSIDSVEQEHVALEGQTGSEEITDSVEQEHAALARQAYHCSGEQERAALLARPAYHKWRPGALRIPATRGFGEGSHHIESVEQERAALETKAFLDKIRADSVEQERAASARRAYLDYLDEITANSFYPYFISDPKLVEHAELALRLYKEERGSDHIDYKLVAKGGWCRRFAIVPGHEDLGILDCCHVSFYVRSNKVGSRQVLFFAELVNFGYGDQLSLQNFSILKRDSSQITYGCQFCPPHKSYPHPREAFFVGKGNFVPIDDMAQKDMALLFEQELISRREFKGTTYFNFKRSLAFLPEPFEDFVLDPSLRARLFSTLEYANLALEWYKEQFGTVDDDYEIVDALGSCRVLSHVPTSMLYEVVDWCHVSFTAKPRDSHCKHDIVLFFAELADFGYGKGLSLNYFMITKLGAPDVTYGCGFCPPNENHPHIRNAHFAGLWDHKPTEVSSQKDMAICFQRQVIANRNKEKTKYTLNELWPEPVKRDPSCFSPMHSDHEYAEIALSYINKYEETEIELVKAIYANRQTCQVGITGYTEWCHVYFIGKCKQGKVSRVHFFAELNDPGVRKFCLGAYTRMDPRGLDSRKGCGICPVNEKYRHPRDLNYGAGNWAHFGCLSHDNALKCTNCSRFAAKKNPEFEGLKIDD